MKRAWRGGGWAWWLAAILWCGLIFGMTADPHFTGQHTGEVVAQVVTAGTPSAQATGGPSAAARVHLLNQVLRKGAHVALYAVLGLLWWRALARPGARAPGRWAWMLTTLYGASDELHELFTPGRGADVPDVMLDSAAAGLVLLAIATLVRRWRDRRSATG